MWCWWWHVRPVHCRGPGAGAGHFVAACGGAGVSQAPACSLLVPVKLEEIEVPEVPDPFHGCVILCLFPTPDLDYFLLWFPLTQVVGDDLLCTNPKRVQRAIDGKNCNALLLKVGGAGGAFCLCVHDRVCGCGFVCAPNRVFAAGLRCTRMACQPRATSLLPPPPPMPDWHPLMHVLLCLCYWPCTCPQPLVPISLLAGQPDRLHHRWVNTLKSTVRSQQPLAPRALRYLHPHAAVVFWQFVRNPMHRGATAGLAC